MPFNNNILSDAVFPINKTSDKLLVPPASPDGPVGPVGPINAPILAFVNSVALQ